MNVVGIARPTPVAVARFFTRRLRATLWAYGFLLPMLALLIAFKFYPIAQALQLSLTNYDLLTTPKFVGLANYQFLLQDHRFRDAVGVTLYYMFGTAIPLWFLSLGLAVAFNRRFPLRNLIRLAYFLPTIMPFVVFGAVWQFLFHPYGLLNQGLHAIGLPGVQWLSNAAAVIPGFILATNWRFVPYFMIVFLAGLQNIPEELRARQQLSTAPRHARRSSTSPCPCCGQRFCWSWSSRSSCSPAASPLRT